MWKHKHRVWLFFLVIIASLSPSCKKYLDVVPPNVGTLEYVFRNRNEAENYLFTCYGTLQGFSDVETDPSFTTSGEIMYPNNLGTPLVNDEGFQLMRGTQNVSDPTLNYWDGSNGGTNIFQAIRRCNIMLDNIDKPVDLSIPEKQRWIAEVKFLKAYYHYYLLKMYGPIPIYKTDPDISVPLEQFKVKRQPTDSVFNYVVQLLDEAIPNLPVTIANLANEQGRITQVIALAVKAEVLATEASPLFNGNPDYSDFKNKDGQALFPSAADPEKWTKATVACKAAIDAANALGLSLYTFIPTADLPVDFSPILSQVLTIQNAVTEKWSLNREIIWELNPYFQRQSNATARLSEDFDLQSAPGTLAVPLSTAELFYTRNGLPIDQDKTWDYSSRYQAQTGDEANKYLISKGYQTIKENFDREIRYYANIGFDGGIWFGNGVRDPDQALFVRARGSKSTAGPKDDTRINVTAIWPKKLVNYLSVFSKIGFASVDFRIPRMRLADLFLLYAECSNERSGPSPEVYAYIDRVRQRAGLKGVVESWAQYSLNPSKPLSKDGLREIIHRERRIELCFEGRAGWDLRRWKEWTSVMTQPIQGWSYLQEDPANFYIPVTQFVPSISLKDYFWPLAFDALQENNNLVQNPYW